MTISRRILPFALSLLALPTIATATPEHGTAERADGSALHWTLDLPDGSEKVGLIVLAQGSGCAAAMQSHAMQQARAAFGNLAALVVEKYGVQPDDDPSDDHMDCSQAFRAHHTLSQRVADYRQIIGSLREAPWWNGDLVLFGGSEGGIVMAMLAPEVQADTAILISTGGGVPFGQMVRQSIPQEGWPTVDAAFKRARQNPDSTELWAGQSLRFWADAIDRRAADDMLRNWTVDGSKAKGQTMVNRQIRLTMRAFNNEAEAAVANVRWNNVNATEKRVHAAIKSINDSNASMRIALRPSYIALKIKEIRLTHEYRES